CKPFTKCSAVIPAYANYRIRIAQWEAKIRITLTLPFNFNPRMRRCLNSYLPFWIKNLSHTTWFLSICDITGFFHETLELSHTDFSTSYPETIFYTHQPRLLTFI